MVRDPLANLFNQGSSEDQPAFNKRPFTVQMQKEGFSSASQTVLWFHGQACMPVSAEIYARCQRQLQT
jgi:hypothetical protein